MGKRKLLVLVGFGLLLTLVLVLAACAGPAGPAGPPGPTGTAQPQTQKLFTDIFHADSWARPAGVNAGLPDPDVIDPNVRFSPRVATMYSWKNPVLVAFEGDMVELTVMNNAGSRTHSLVIPELGVDTGPIEPRGEGANAPPVGKGQTKTVTFGPVKAGTYKFACGIPFAPGTGLCSPDHPYQYGYLQVLKK